MLVTSIERSYKRCLVFSGLYFFPLFYGSSSSYVGVEVRIASFLFDLINNCNVDATFWLPAILPSALITFLRATYTGLHTVCCHCHRHSPVHVFDQVEYKKPSMNLYPC